MTNFRPLWNVESRQSRLVTRCVSSTSFFRSYRLEFKTARLRSGRLPRSFPSFLRVYFDLKKMLCFFFFLDNRNRIEFQSNRHKIVLLLPVTIFFFKSMLTSCLLSFSAGILRDGFNTPIGYVFDTWCHLLFAIDIRTKRLFSLFYLFIFFKLNIWLVDLLSGQTMLPPFHRDKWKAIRYQRQGYWSERMVHLATDASRRWEKVGALCRGHLFLIKYQRIVSLTESLVGKHGDGKNPPMDFQTPTTLDTWSWSWFDIDQTTSLVRHPSRCHK